MPINACMRCLSLLVSFFTSINLLYTCIWWHCSMLILACGYSQCCLLLDFSIMLICHRHWLLKYFLGVNRKVKLKWPKYLCLLSTTPNNYLKIITFAYKVRPKQTLYQNCRTPMRFLTLCFDKLFYLKLSWKDFLILWI